MNKDDNPFLDEPGQDSGKLPDVNNLREQGEQIIKFLPQLIEEFKYLSGIQNRTPEEDAKYFELAKTLNECLSVIQYLKDFFGERLYKQSTAIYYRAKELAEKGDLEAQKIVDDLKPHFKESLKDSFGTN